MVKDGCKMGAERKRVRKRRQENGGNERRLVRNERGAPYSPFTTAPKYKKVEDKMGKDVA